ncbi:hypothetical protein [Segatella oulorum]|uniref:hypothetical protein n=1 Tax=Segatella oulorum TaxID=28136 RepID=UPI0023F3FC59|nr:hypothetical protein [Segatella oulorum]
MTIQLAKAGAFLQSLFTKMVVSVASNHVISALMNRERSSQRQRIATERLTALWGFSLSLVFNLYHFMAQSIADYQVITMKLRDNYYHFTQQVIANNTQKCQYSAHEVLAFLLAKDL